MAGSPPLTRADLEQIEAKLNAILRMLTAVHTNGHSGLLRGYAAIGAHVGLAPSTVRGYVRSMGLPAVRLGRHRVSSPALIDGWLLSVDRMKRKRLESVRAR
jgi:hypothetical protein